MRLVLHAALLLTTSLTLAPALADEVAPTASTAQSATPAAPAAATPVSRTQLVAQYSAAIADRTRAIGAGLFEAGFQGGWQFSSALGFGEIPTLRYGITDSLEVNLLGARYIIDEDSRYIPGLSVRAQLHDLAYQNNNTLNYNYAALRPGVFFEFRDRLPFHLAANGEIGYVVSIQAGNTAPDGTPINAGARIPASGAPMDLELQWSPLDFLSFAAKVGYLEDTATPAYSAPTQSDATFSVAAIYNTSRFDLRVYYQANWFANPVLGFVPEVGASAAVRL